jgi:hypothetical protein
VEARGVYRSAQRRERRASEAVERLLNELESRQGFLPFDDSPRGDHSGGLAAQAQDIKNAVN